MRAKTTFSNKQISHLLIFAEWTMLRTLNQKSEKIGHHGLPMRKNFRITLARKAPKTVKNIKFWLKKTML